MRLAFTRIDFEHADAVDSASTWTIPAGVENLKFRRNNVRGFAQIRVAFAIYESTFKARAFFDGISAGECYKGSDQNDKFLSVYHFVCRFININYNSLND